jgi:hypothetical protein
LFRGNQDEATRRRLIFLNQVLTKVIHCFEEAFPECLNALPKPKPDYEPDFSDDDDEEEDIEKDDDVSGSPPSPTLLRRSSSMTELARGLELEEGDVHRFGSFIKKRNLIGVETDLSSEQLLEAILKVDKETVEREVWDKDGLRKVLQKSIDAESSKSIEVQNATVLEKPGEAVKESVAVERVIATREKRDSDSHSI